MFIFNLIATIITLIYIAYWYYICKSGRSSFDFAINGFVYSLMSGIAVSILWIIYFTFLNI